MITPPEQFDSNNKRSLWISDYLTELRNLSCPTSTILTGLLSFILTNDVALRLLLLSPSGIRRYPFDFHKVNDEFILFKSIYSEFVTPKSSKPKYKTTNSTPEQESTQKHVDVTENQIKIPEYPSATLQEHNSDETKNEKSMLKISNLFEKVKLYQNNLCVPWK